MELLNPPSLRCTAIALKNSRPKPLLGIFILPTQLWCQAPKSQIPLEGYGACLFSKAQSHVTRGEFCCDLQYNSDMEQCYLKSSRIPLCRHFLCVIHFSLHSNYESVFFIWTWSLPLLLFSRNPCRVTDWYDYTTILAKIIVITERSKLFLTPPPPPHSPLRWKHCESQCEIRHVYRNTYTVKYS